MLVGESSVYHIAVLVFVTNAKRHSWCGKVDPRFCRYFLIFPASVSSGLIDWLCDVDMAN